MSYNPSSGSLPSKVGQSLKFLRVNVGEDAEEWATASGSGDVVGPVVSVASQIALFDGITGKLIKADTTTGLVKSTVGVISAAIGDTDYALPSTVALKAPLANPTFTGTISGITKAMVGLGSVVDSDTTTTSNITDSLNKRFVTDANLTTIGNQSGTNTGDQDLSGKQNTLVSGTNIKTINGGSVLGAGDLVVSGATSITEVEIDFGSVPIKSKKFTITDGTIISSNKITATLSYANPSDGEEDSAEWFEDLTLMARAGTGEFFLYANSPYKDLNGKVKVNYIKG